MNHTTKLWERMIEIRMRGYGENFGFIMIVTYTIKSNSSHETNDRVL